MRFRIAPQMFEAELRHVIRKKGRRDLVVHDGQIDVFQLQIPLKTAQQIDAFLAELLAAALNPDRSVYGPTFGSDFLNSFGADFAGLLDTALTSMAWSLPNFPSGTQAQGAHKDSGTMCR